MFKEIDVKTIPKEIFKPGFKIAFPAGSEDVYFILGSEFSGSLADFLDDIQRQTDNPCGIVNITAIDDKKYFRVAYYPEIIAKDKVNKWLTQIFK